MGYVTAMSPCIACKNVFSYNPHKVPSIRINGVREPICRECIPRINRLRAQAGTDPIVPAPDAYEAISEYEL